MYVGASIANEGIVNQLWAEVYTDEDKITGTGIVRGGDGCDGGEAIGGDGGD